MIENENKICFIVELSAKKPQIAEAVDTLYKQKVIKVNTARTIYGKKAFVQFESTEKGQRSCNENRNALIWIIKLEVR